MLVRIFLLSFLFSWSVQAENCLICSWPVKEPSASENLCEDLAPAACENPDGTSVYRDKIKNLNQKLRSLIDQAKDLSAVKMGYRNAEDAINKTLESAGGKLKENLSYSAKEYFYTGDYSNYVSAEELYETAAQCKQEQSTMSKISYSESAFDKIKEMQQKTDALLQKYNKLRVELYSKNLPQFVSEVFSQCRSYRKKQRNLSPDQVLSDPKIEILQKTCENAPAIRRQAIALFRKEGFVEYLEQARKLVEGNVSALDASWYETKQISKEEAPNVPTSEFYKAIQKYSRDLYSFSVLCASVAKAVDASAKKSREEILKKLSRGRPTVEFLLDYFYTQDREKKLKAIFDQIKSEAVRIALRLTADPNKRKKILDTYSRLQFTWLKKPANADYNQESQIEVLRDVQTIVDSFAIAAFEDNTLSYFTLRNAFYKPDISYGALSKGLSVSITPLFILLADENPYSFLSIVAHETGHNLGPRLSQINGYDLSSEWASTLSCLSQTDSIRMQQDQKDEAIADYMSAEIIAAMVKKLPPENRPKAVTASLESFCHINAAAEEDQLSLDVLTSHPNPMLRISGIFGGNAHLRGAMGCDVDSTQYRTCRMK